MSLFFWVFFLPKKEITYGYGYFSILDYNMWDDLFCEMCKQFYNISENS